MCRQYRAKLLLSQSPLKKCPVTSTTLLLMVTGLLSIQLQCHGLSEEGSASGDTFPTQPPSSPMIEIINVQSNSFTLNWTTGQEDVVDCYEIAYDYQGPCVVDDDELNFSNRTIVNGSVTEYTVSGLQEFSLYNVTLTALNNAGNSSDTTTVTTLSSAPSGPPQSLIVTSKTPFSINIQWDTVNCSEQNGMITGYSVRYGERTISVIGDNDRTYNATELFPSTSYTFEVAAVNVNGNGTQYAMVTMSTDTYNGVGFLLNGTLYDNNSIVTLNEIGEDNAALYCLTNKTDCCRPSDTPAGVGPIGTWFFPDGSEVNNRGSSVGGIYRTRGPTYVVLNRRNNSQTTGVFRCEVPDASRTNRTLHIGVYPMNSGSPSITELSYNRSTRTLTCTSTGGPATTVTWTRNNVEITMDESNIQEQRIVNATLGEYQNTLIITSDTLDDYDGSFTCSVSNLRGNSDNSIMIQAIQITGHEQPLTLGEPAAINCSSDLEVERIEWLNSDNEVLEASNSRELQWLTFSIPRVDHGENNTVYKCRITVTQPNENRIQPVTLSVKSRFEPFPPQNVSSSEMNANSVKISWTVPIIAFAQETYVVLYGVKSTSELSSREQYSSPNVMQYHVILNDLSPSTEYRYIVRATNNASRSNSSDEMTFITASAASSSVGAAVGAVFGILIVILIAVSIIITAIVLWSFRRKRKSVFSPADNDYRQSQLASNEYVAPTVQLKMKSLEAVEEATDTENSSSHHQDKEENEDYFENVSAIVNDHLRPIPIVKFEERVKEMHLNRDRLFELEYTSISSVPQATSDISAIPHNKERNRFDNIYPYDFSRVPLKKIPGEEGSDYINASFIDGYKQPKAYIAAQGPLPNTIADFWRMIWEYKLPTVVMLTRCFEERKKCELYWPEKIGESIKQGQDLTIKLEALLPFAEYTIRTLSVDCSSEPDVPTLEVTQFHFVGWPDHGVPGNAIILINFIRRVRRAHPITDERHMLVHCSAGVGRTGTFIILDSMLQRMKEEDSVNVYESVRKLRTQRVEMVQTQAQYVFIHDALNELIICGDTEIGVANLWIAISKLNEIDDNKETGFQKQFQNLDKVAPKILEIDYSHANEEHNLTKNRYQSKIPNNFKRVCLKTTGTSGSDYINASHIDGYRQRGTYIATQGPLESTVNDFWRMIWEQKSHCIVMLCDLLEDGMESSQCYWPTAKGSCETYGKIIVKLKSDKSREDYVVRKFELTEDKKLSSLTFSPSALQVTQFQFLRWTEHSPPQKIISLLELMEQVNKVQMSSGNKAITVMCNDGVGRSGTFICIHSQLERLKTEGVVDFFQAIKSARIQRAELVPEVSQYKFCHDAVASYLDKFDAYANFKF